MIKRVEDKTSVCNGLSNMIEIDYSRLPIKMNNTFWPIVRNLKRIHYNYLLSCHFWSYSLSLTICFYDLTNDAFSCTKCFSKYQLETKLYFLLYSNKHYFWHT